MFFLINIFFIVFFHIFMKAFFRFEKINFKKIIFYFLFFYFILILVTYSNLIKIKYSDLNILYFVINLLIFLSYILTIGLKKINSPTFYILETLEKKNVVDKNELLKDLENKKIFEERFVELQNENMIILKNNEMSLTKNGRSFALFMKCISIFFGVKSKG